MRCNYYLPKTDYHLESTNEFTERLWGRVDIEAGAAAFFFRKKSTVQRLIHEFKYKNRPEIGFLVGYTYGLKLAKSELFNSIERIIPVPLHPAKQRIRGFNQSNVFADGLSAGMGVPAVKNALIRTANTQTQTLKGAIERIENVEEIFSIADPKNIENQHVLLVDDVMTTGSTLEACALPILNITSQISMVTMAIAMNN